MEKIWNLMRRQSNAFKKSGGTDGQAYWRKVKGILGKYDNKIRFKWIFKNRPKKVSLAVLALPEKIIDGMGNEVMNEINHHIIQTVRIPIKEKANIRKLIQVALNIGLYTGNGKGAKKWMKLDCYIKKSELNALDKKFEKELEYLYNQMKPKLQV